MVELHIRVLPSSSRREIRMLPDGTIKAALKSPPQKGKANSELVKFLSGMLKVKRGDIKIKSGLKSRNKKILIRGSDGVSFRKSLEKYCK